MMVQNWENSAEVQRVKLTGLQKWLLYALAVIVTVTIGLAIWASTMPDSYYEKDGSLTLETETDFMFIAKDAIEDYLKAPSTLELDYSSCTWRAYENDVFSLAGKFSSENAFGVPLVSDFYVSFWYGGDYDNSTVIKVVIDNEVYYERSN